MAARVVKEGCVEFYVYIPKEQKEELKKEAKEDDLSMSSLARRIFSAHLKKRIKKK